MQDRAVLPTDELAKSSQMRMPLVGSIVSWPLVSTYRNCSGDASSNTNTTGDIPAGTSVKFLSSICAIVIGR